MPYDFKKPRWAIIALVVLVLAIGLTPRINVGTVEGLGRQIDIRGEDIWILVLALVWISTFLKSKKLNNERPPLLMPILLWLGAGFLSLLINWLFGNLNIPRGFFYFVKELQFFFVYFFILFHARKLTTANTLMHIWLGVGLANISWVLYQLFFTARGFGEYGTSALNEWGVFPTGAFFSFLFIFLFNWWLYYFWRKSFWVKEYLYLAAILVIIIGILGALSITTFFGFWFGFIVSMLLYVWREKTLKTMMASVLLFAGVSLFTLGAYFFLILPNLEDAERLGVVVSPGKVAADVRRELVEPIMIPSFQAAISRPIAESIFGSGRGVILLGPESHNYYLRNFIETGIFGSIAFFLLIAAILTTSWKGFRQKVAETSSHLPERSEGREMNEIQRTPPNSDSPRSANGEMAIGFSAGVIVATLTMLFMSLVVDGFIVVKPNMTYWFFVGLATAVLYHQRNKNL